MVIDLDILGRILTTAVTTLGLIGLMYKFVVLPNLRGEFAPSSKMAAQVAETHRQVTVNQHASPQPTVLDQIDDLRGDVSDMQGLLVQALANQVAMLGEVRVFAEKSTAHEQWSSAEARRLWAAIEASRPGPQEGDRP